MIPYNAELKDRARDLRNVSTFGEVLLWKRLRARQFHGYKFNRQKPLLDFIADFYCFELSLVIEVDGNSHRRREVELRDARKEFALRKYGVKVLRFTEWQVRFQMDDALRSLEHYVRCYEEA